MSEQNLLFEIDSFSSRIDSIILKIAEFKLSLRSLRQQYSTIETDLIELKLEKDKLVEELRVLRLKSGLRADGSLP